MSKKERWSICKFLLRIFFPPVEVKVWKTIRLGTGIKSADDFRKEIIKAGQEVTESAFEMMYGQDFHISSSEQEVDLVRISSLGNYDDVCEEAMSMGLELCPAEVGPQLRLQYKNQPKGNILYVSTKPLHDDYRNHDYDNECEELHLFKLRHNNVLELADSWMGFQNRRNFFGRRRYVFVKPRRVKV